MGWNSLPMHRERGIKGDVYDIQLPIISPMKNKIIPYNKDLKNLARDLRKKRILSEVLLWKQLKGKSLGYEFHRQVPMLDYIVDFYCRELQLVIELDGPIHEYQQEYDTLRTRDLEKIGLLVIRYPNDEVLFEREELLSELRIVCDTRTSNLRPRTPPPLP